MFDKETMLKRMGNDEDIAREIIQVFLDTTPELITTLEEALASGSLEVIHRHAHSLKGSAANVEATAIRELALAIETKAKSNDLQGVPEILQQIKTAFRRYTDEVETAFQHKPDSGDTAAEYTVNKIRITQPPPWQDPVWEDLPCLEVSHFHPDGSSHHPHTTCQLGYDATGFHGLFTVQDQFVLCRYHQFQDPVYLDSCVEFFVQPRPDGGYFNFEMNGNAALLCQFIEDETRLPEGGFKKYISIPENLGKTITLHSTMKQAAEPEIKSPLRWQLYFHIPFAVFEPFIGAVNTATGETWKANFFKCAEDNSHPHWAAWVPVGETRNFHQPRRFGSIIFE